MLAAALEVIKSRKATLHSLGAVMGLQLLTSVLALAACLVQGRFIDPGVLGYFSAFAIPAQYLCFLNIGWISSLQRDYPYWIGKGDTERANQVVSVCSGWVLLAAGLMAAAYSLLVVGHLVAGNFAASAGWATQLLTAILSFYAVFLGCSYRSTNEFVTWSKLNAVTSVISFFLLPLVALLGFWGLCVRAAVPASIGGWLLHRFRPVRVAPQWNLRELWRLVKFGLAMDLSGFLATACLSATMSSIVASFYGLAVLGLFAFARMGEATVAQFATAVVAVFIPRIHQQMGMTESLRHCVRYSLKPMLAAVCVTAPLLLVASILSEPLIRILMPKYVDGVPILIVCLWVALRPGLSIPTYTLIAAKHTWAIAAGNLTCFTVFVALAAAAVLLHLPPVYVAVSYLAGNLAYVLVCWGMLWMRLRSSDRDAVLPDTPTRGDAYDSAPALSGWTQSEP